MVIVPFLGRHRLFRVYTVQVLKIRTVVLDDFAKNLSLSLLQKLLKGIAIDEEAFPRRVRVQVKKEVDPIKAIQPSCDSPY